MDRNTACCKTASIYYMSGTGNSLRIASWLGDLAREQGMTGDVHSIDRKYQPPTGTWGRDHLMGLTFPTHGFTTPWPILRFALSLPQGRGTNVLIIPTRAGTKFGRVYLPGMQGTAGYLLALIMVLKGYRVRGVFGIDMPSNWTALHWGLSEANASAIIERAQKKVTSLATVIFAGGQVWRGAIELLLGLGLAPVSLGYLLYGRFQLAKLFFASEACNGCRLCAENCPVGAIKMHGRKPYWTYKCESCMRCMNFCPPRAIEVSLPLAVGLTYIAGLPVVDYLLNRMDNAIPVLNSGPSLFIMQYIYFLTSIFLVYLFFTLINRIPLVSKVFKVFTLTQFYRRYHEPKTKISDFKGSK